MRSALHRHRVAVLLGCALCVALTAAGAASAALPSGFALQQQFTSGATVEYPSFVDATHGWATDTGGRTLYRTTDGRHWRTSAPAAWSASVKFVAFGTRSTGWAFSEPGEVFKTTDGGTKWTRQTVPSLRSGDLVNGGCATDGAHAWFYTQDGAIVGTVDGSHWKTQFSDFSERLYAGHFTGTTRGVIVGFDTNTPTGAALVLTTTTGAQWTKQATFGPGEELTSVWFSGALKGWAAAIDGSQGPGHVYATGDGGLTWTLVGSDVFPGGASQSPNIPWQSLAFVSPTHGFLGTYCPAGQQSCLYETTNGGASWTPFAPAGSGSASILGMTAVGSDHVWATGAAAGGCIWDWATSIGRPVIGASYLNKLGEVVEGHRVSATGTVLPAQTPGTFAISVTLQKNVRSRWTTESSGSAKLGGGGASYSCGMAFSSTGRWRIRAVHGSATTSSWSYYTVVS
jgi:photosystem II stability/assembly factor-like uncharacterized protein